MKLKPAILSVLGRDDLKHIVDDLEIDGVDRRSVEGMRVALGRARRVKAADLLWYMQKGQIKEVCEEIGLPTSGKRDELVERLLNGPEATMKKRALKDKATDSQTANVVATKKSNDPPAQRYEAIWLEGPVPSRYWDHPENRRLYVRWLGQELGFRKQEDWYRISTDDFKRNSGGGLLEHHWSGSAIGAVKECFPDYDWKDWLFRYAPRQFWRDPRNHRRYMKWLGQELGIRRPSGWYGVTNQDFKDHKGGAFLLQYHSTVSAAIMSYLPSYDWKEWLFDNSPRGFWRKRTNRRRYMIWLGKRLGFKHIKDWYSVTMTDFRANHGSQFLQLHGGLPLAAVRDSFPRYTWNEWMFAAVPVGFWDEPENRKRYMRWLGRKLKFKKPQDWYKIRRHDFGANCGGGLLLRYRSCFDLLKECIPELDWEKE